MNFIRFSKFTHVDVIAIVTAREISTIATRHDLVSNYLSSFTGRKNIRSFINEASKTFLSIRSHNLSSSSRVASFSKETLDN